MKTHLAQCLPSIPLSRLLPGALAAMAIGFSMNSHAGGGEALDLELPSMRTPVELQQPVMQPSWSPPTAAPAAADMSVATSEAAMVDTSAPLKAAAPLTRAEVRESVKLARLSNTMGPSGEIGDTPQVLQAREEFNALQAEVLQAEYAATAQRQQQEQPALSQTTSDQNLGLAEPAMASVASEVAAAEASEQQIVVAPQMTVGELMSFLQDSQAQGTVVVMLPNEDAQEED